MHYKVINKTQIALHHKEINMEKEVEKKPIGPTLKRMQVGDKETFPVWRALSVRSTIGQIQTVTDMRFSTSSEYPDFIVTRKQ